MRYLALTLAVLLAGCDAGQVSSMAHSPAVKQLAELGQHLLTPAEPGNAPPDPASAGTTFPLVNGKSAVGHRDFANAKKILPALYRGMEEDFYCGCKYTGKAVDFASCGYTPRKNATRASRIEWEHVVPA